MTHWPSLTDGKSGEEPGGRHHLAHRGGVVQHHGVAVAVHHRQLRRGNAGALNGTGTTVTADGVSHVQASAMQTRAPRSAVRAAQRRGVPTSPRWRPAGDAPIADHMSRRSGRKRRTPVMAEGCRPPFCASDPPVNGRQGLLAS